MLAAIDQAKPDIVICFGPTATASVFDHGSLSQNEMFRKAHYPLGNPVKCEACLGYGYTVDENLADRQDCEVCEGEGQIHPDGPGPPVYVTVGLSATRWKAGLQKWLRWDVEAAVNGWGETEWGDYTILLPDSPIWDECPEELRCFLPTNASTPSGS